MKHNLSEIMKNAWSLFRMSKKWVGTTIKTFADALRQAWGMAKDAVKAAEEAAQKGIVRMHYSEYKKNYSECKTVEGSYDKRTKTIEVITKQSKKTNGLFGLCPRCHSWCYSDCECTK